MKGSTNPIKYKILITRIYIKILIYEYKNRGYLFKHIQSYLLKIKFKN